MNLYRIFLTFCFIALPSLARADVWVATAAWDDAQDQAFSEWIEKLPLDIFTAANSPYRGIRTDCADAAYVLRILFAYERRLPVNFTNFDNKDLSNANKEFDSAPEGVVRVKRFINFVRSHTSTQSLAADSYPVDISRKFIRGGTLFLHPEGNKAVPLTYRSGHVYYVQRVYENGIVRFFSSTVPSAVRDLQPRNDVVFAPFGTDGGYRAWKRPGSDLRPGESDRQFTLARWRPNAYRDGRLWQNWHDVVRSRLATRSVTPEEELNANAENVAGYIKERTNLVLDSWKLYQSKYRGQSCMDAKDYDGYSTPTRDVKIQGELEALRQSIVNYLTAEGASGSDYEVQGVLSRYKFQVIPGAAPLDLNQIWNAFETETVLAISEPEHSPAVRWGLEPQRRWPCPDRAKQYVGGDRVRQEPN